MPGNLSSRFHHSTQDNHPSGDTSPSREDILITERLVDAGEIVGIKVLDHVIIGDDGYTSMLEKGYIKT